MPFVTQKELDELTGKAAEADRLAALLNAPELIEFSSAVVREAAHQRVRWAADSDAAKTPADWFWLVGHLATRALEQHKEAELAMKHIAGLSEIESDDGADLSLFHEMAIRDLNRHREKAVHHCITAAAALANWHAHVLGLHTSMRPGADPAKVQV